MKLKSKYLGLNTLSETSRCISSVFPCLNNRLTWFSDCVISGSPEGGTHVVRFTAQVPLRMHKTALDVTLAAACNSLRHHWLLSLHWIFLRYTDRATSPWLLQICVRPSPTTMLTWIWLWWWQRYHVQGRIQDLKLGVAQMDGKIWKHGWVNRWGWGIFFIECIYFTQGQPYSYTVLSWCPVTK